MSLKFKLTSAIMGVILAVIVVFSGFFVLMNEINRPVREITLFMGIFALVMLAVSALVTFFFARSIVNSITAVTLVLKDIAEGEGDLSRRIVNHSKDEVGDLSHYYNLSMNKIENIVDKIKDEAAALSRISNNLACNMNHTAIVMGEIAANIQNIKGRVINQSVSVSQTSTLASAS